MADGITINLAEFRAAFREYREVSRRDDAQILNTKAFYIARGAVRDTYRPSKEQVRKELEKLFQGQQIKKAMVTRFHTSANRLGQTYQAPLAALIINANRGKRGLPGLSWERMKRAIKSFAARKYRSIAFIASGFLPAVKALEPFAERKGSAPPLDREVKQYGAAKGSGLPAAKSSERITARAVIVNAANAKGDKTGALEKYGGAGLALAFAREIASMRQYIEQKKQATANKFNGR